jgi:flagellar basal-body rod modification protein FlgD
MDITAASTTAASAAGANSRTQLASNYETFLTLLTAQLRNQDPLSPMNSTEFTQQLVQFSSVEQQISTNDQLRQLISMQTAAASNSALAWIGRGAVVNTDTARLGPSGNVEWSVEAADSRRVRLEVLDASGRVVRSLERPAAEARTFSWDGLGDLGAPVGSAAYTLRASTIPDDASEPRVLAVSLSTRIDGVDFGGGTARVTTPAGTFELGRIARIFE